jgi:hypothetical protein
MNTVGPAVRHACIRRLMPLLMAGLCACSSAPQTDSTLQLAFQKLVAYRGPGLEEDLDELRENGFSLTAEEAVLLDAPQGECILVCHFFWTVAVALLDKDLNLRDVQSHNAKCGFSVDWNAGLVVTFHEHPGTDMSYDTPCRLRVEGSRLRIDEIDDEQAGW